MKLLLIDSSSSEIEFGLFDESKEIFRHSLSESENADALVFNIDKYCRENNFALKDLDYVSISNGPGSFTGLRISSAIAKAICLASDAKLIEINSLDVLANKVETDKIITALIFSNSRTNEFYYAKYEKNDGLNRVSDYGIALLSDILNDDDFFISNSKMEDFTEKIMYSEHSNLISFYQLTMNYISQKKYSDYNTSEPFYMKDFVPLKSQKKLL